MNNSRIKVLIGDDSAEYGVKVASKLCEMGIYAYTRRKEGKHIYDSIANDNPDVVVADFHMPDFDVLALMSKTSDFLDAKPVFIVAADADSKYVERQVMDCGASYFITKPYETETLSSIIKSVTKNMFFQGCMDTEVIVTNIIHKLGVPAHIKGYSYLRTAILSAVNDRSLLDSVTRRLYPYVADIHGTFPSRVERAIRSAIQTAWDRGDEKFIRSFFGYSSKSFRGRPTNAEFIALVTDRISLQRKQFTQ